MGDNYFWRSKYFGHLICLSVHLSFKTFLKILVLKELHARRRQNERFLFLLEEYMFINFPVISFLFQKGALLIPGRFVDAISKSNEGYSFCWPKNLEILFSEEKFGNTKRWNVCQDENLIKRPSDLSQCTKSSKPISVLKGTRTFYQPASISISALLDFEYAICSRINSLLVVSESIIVHTKLWETVMRVGILGFLDYL